ncbi:MAG: hypothetical protein ABI779_22730 [Acidobacteriota bacterium]
MQFLEESQIEEWCMEHQVALPLSEAECAVASTRFFGQAVSPRGQEADVVTAVLAELGEWDECLLWIDEWSIWPSSENWPAYYAERGVHGERRSLRVAPGHLAGGEDRDALTTFLRIVLENAWGAYVIPVMSAHTTGRWAHASHDEFVDVLVASQHGANRG